MTVVRAGKNTLGTYSNCCYGKGIFSLILLRKSVSKDENAENDRKEKKKGC